MEPLLVGARHSVPSSTHRFALCLSPVSGQHAPPAAPHPSGLARHSDGCGAPGVAVGEGGNSMQ